MNIVPTHSALASSYHQVLFFDFLFIRERVLVRSLRDVRRRRVVLQYLLCNRGDSRIKKLGFGKDVGVRCAGNTMNRERSKSKNDGVF